ncbi:hypothetical protein [Neomegalonema sp.]|uniref:hypothetical protein n=1 Tax=Neomegalonema sp. TaxID=2039713 RepID=UPI002610FF47|nr:hypothetical protein [Neomegalonema sp.]MDD2870314.1 hypothetical protein [Neomegalonema sp.]
MADSCPITRRNALKAALGASALSLPALALEAAPADTLGAWLDQEAFLADRERFLVREACAKACAEGRSEAEAEEEILKETYALERAHMAKLSEMRIGKPATARRVLGWISEEWRGRQELMTAALDAYLAGLEG